MIKGIGVDICDLRRLTSLESLAKKILHEEELKIFCQKKNEKAKREFLGGRFAVKEAYIKACGSLPLKEICCLNDEQGRPYLLNQKRHVSISHENNYAIAFIVVEE